jgi:hypothetical protein
MRGSAFSIEDLSFVHAENMAIARSEAARTRAAEKLVTNSLPGTSDEKLGSWAEAQGVQILATDTRHDVRQRCAAKYEVATGNAKPDVDAAIETLLGAAFVKSWRQEGTDLANPPLITWWPGVNPGAVEFDLGGGAWLSERAHLVIEVDQPDDMTDQEFLELLNLHLFKLINPLLPAWMTADWALFPLDGFHLDVDDLDYHGLTP